MNNNMRGAYGTFQSSALGMLRYATITVTVIAAVFLYTSVAFAASASIATGMVTDISDDSPVSGATVECHTANGNVTSNDVTAFDGSYNCRLDDTEISIGQTIVVELRDFAGYVGSSGENITWNGVSQKVDFQLTAAPKTVNVTVRNNEGEDVQADVTAQPVAVEPGNAGRQVSTNVTGSGSLEMTGGRWMITVGPNLSETNADTYPWVTQTIAQEVVFAEDGTTESTAIAFEVIKSEYKVQIKMVDVNGGILTQDSFNGDIWFDGYNSDYGAMSARRKINATTGVAEVYLMPGVWKVSAYHSQLDGQSFNPAEVTFVLDDEPGTTDWGTVTAVENNGSIAGTLELLNGGSLNNLQIVATNVDNGSQARTNVDGKGAWSMSNLGPGQYSITLDNDQYAPVQTGSAVIEGNADAITGVELSANIMNATVAGTIKDGSGDAVTDLQASVVLSSSDGEFEFSAPVESDGTYTMPLFTTDVLTTGMELTLVPLPGAEVFQAESVAVTIGAGTTAGNITTSDDEATITGNIVNQLDVDLGSADFGKGAEVMALNVDTGAVETADIESNGSYSMDVGPGTWKLVPQIDDIDAGVFAAKAGGDEFTVTAGESKIVDASVLEGEGTISGTILDENGTAVAEAPVLITNLPALQAAAGSGEVDESKVFSLVVNTSNTGEFEEIVPSGELTVIYGSNPEVADLTEPTQKTVTLDMGGTVTADGAFRAAPNTVSGDIGADFEIGTVTATSAIGGTEKVEVAEDGTYEMNLANGDWTLFASGVKDGNVYMAEKDVTVTGGAEKTVDPEMGDTGVEFPAAITKTADSSETIAITNADGASVSLPAYSTGFSGDVTVTLQPLIERNNSGDISQVGLAYDVQVIDSGGVPVKSLNRDATVTLPIDEELKGSVDPKEMTAGYHNEQLESFLFDGMVADTNGDKMVIQTSHFSKFAVTTTGDVSVAGETVIKPKKPKFNKFKAKKLKKLKRSIRWNLRAGETKAKLLLQKQKKNKKWKKVKLFKNITSDTTRIKKTIGKKFLKSGKTYRVRVKVKNSAGWSKFSKARKFTIK